MAIDSNRAYLANLGRPAPSEAPVKLSSESFADDDVASNRASGCLPMTRGSDGDRCRRQQRRARLHQNRPCSEAEIRMHGLQRSRHRTYLAPPIHSRQSCTGTGAIEVRPLRARIGADKIEILQIFSARRSCRYGIAANDTRILEISAKPSRRRAACTCATQRLLARPHRDLLRWGKALWASATRFFAVSYLKYPSSCPALSPNWYAARHDPHAAPTHTHPRHRERVIHMPPHRRTDGAGQICRREALRPVTPPVPASARQPAARSH